MGVKSEMLIQVKFLCSLVFLLVCFFHKCSAKRKKVVTIDGNCPSDPHLERLVKTPGTKTLLYIVSYNNASQFVANQYAACRQSWVKVIRIPLTKYYESAVYFYLNAHKSEWRGYQYVTLATYKSLTPSLLHPTLPPQTFENVKQMLELAVNDIADVYPFVRGSQRLLNSTMSYHGEDFSNAWLSIMKELGVEDKAVKKCNDMYPFYRNLYMVKSHYLERLVLTILKIFKAISENNRLSALLTKDANYQLGSPNIAQKMFGTSYYQYHPFLFQLFSPCILKLLGARICIAPLGSCGVNYMYQG